jgi:DNA (cytosine-5)-methyltransferase 1
MLTFGSLFAGIGGFDLGLERAGMECRWQVEIDPFARRVLEKHWPNVMRWDDVKTFPPEQLEKYKVDLICGGFPCQDISYAGKGAGIDGERSGLWAQYARIIRDLRPRYVVVENVAALLTRGLGRVLGDLAALGYDAEWECLPAAAVGAPHIRDRIFILGHAKCPSEDAYAQTGPPRDTTRQSGGQSSDMAHPESGDAGRIFGRNDQRKGLGSAKVGSRLRDQSSNSGCDLSHGYRAESKGCETPIGGQADGTPFQPIGMLSGRIREQWAIEPDVGRMADGVPARLDRLRGLGNAVVPQLAELIGNYINIHA